MMLLEVSQPISLSQYLGCLHAFVGQFQSEIFMLKSLAMRIRGRARREVFGWAATLDETRYRIPLMVERWRYFNETARERLAVEPGDSGKYAYVPDLKRVGHVCGELEDMLRRTNDFIDGLEVFEVDDVRMIGEMVAALDGEVEQDRKDVARIVEMIDEEPDVTVAPDKATGLMMIDDPQEGTSFRDQFGEARSLFVDHLRSGC